MSVKSLEELEVILGKSEPAWTKLFSYIRTKYAMDEFWDGKDEVKLRRSGKTFATFYVHEGYFSLMIIFGKKERETFESMQGEFPQFVIDKYNSSKTYHDGKWMLFDIYNDKDMDSFIKLLNIKKKPNRKKEDLTNAVLSVCGNRCDQCLLYYKNSADGGNILFAEGEHRCYHRSDEQISDYSTRHCKGCQEYYDSCAVVKCALGRGYKSCMECDYENCDTHESNFTIPGRCNVGISNDDIEKFILPYCGKERFDAMKESK